MRSLYGKPGCGSRKEDPRKKDHKIRGVSWEAGKERSRVCGEGSDGKDRSGKVLASEGFKGAKSRWGSSYSPEEYRKAISDAYMEMINNIFRNDAFMQKLL